MFRRVAQRMESMDVNIDNFAALAYLQHNATTFEILASCQTALTLNAQFSLSAISTPISTSVLSTLWPTHQQQQVCPEHAAAQNGFERKTPASRFTAIISVSQHII